jgi:hypothetical protein
MLHAAAPIDSKAQLHVRLFSSQLPSSSYGTTATAAGR